MCSSLLSGLLFCSSLVDVASTVVIQIVLVVVAAPAVVDIIVAIAL